MRISEVAGETGLSVSNIRFYEKKGLLSPERKEDSKYRDYTEEDIKRLKRIILYRKMDLSLEMIYLLLNETASVRSVIERQKKELVEKQRMLQGSIDLCSRILTEPNMEQVDVEWYLNYIKEEEDRGTPFALIEEILDDASQCYGFSNLCGDPWVGNLMRHKWVIRGFSFVWLLICFLLPITQIWIHIVEEGSIRPANAVFWCLWGGAVIYPFIRYKKHKSRTHGETIRKDICI